MRYEVSCAVTIYVETDSPRKAADLAKRSLQLLYVAETLCVDFEGDGTEIVVMNDKGEICDPDDDMRPQPQEPTP